MVIRGFYFITAAHLSKSGNVEDVKSALKSGVTIVQYRAQGLSTKEMVAEGVRLRALCKKALFIVNDRVDIALAVEADGVHLGQSDMSLPLARRLLGRRRIIGVTVHTLAEAYGARKQGADYIGVSPIFATATKKDAGSSVGVELITKIKKAVPLPIVAIGGITLGNAPEVIQAGADALCAISAVVTKRDVKKEIKKFQQLFRKKHA